MAHDEYQIPEHYSEPEIRAQIDAIETPRTPERELAPYQYIKNIENKIFSYRESALALDTPVAARTLRGALTGLVHKPQPVTIASLIEAESDTLFIRKKASDPLATPFKFWLDNKSNNTVFHNNVADWYHSQFNPVDPKNPIVLRFQTTPHTIHKLYDGREYAPTLEEIENFVKAVEDYDAAILPLYPLDQTINDLQRNDFDLAA